MVYYVFTAAREIYDARLDGERLLFEWLSRWPLDRVYGLYRGCARHVQVLSNCKFIICVKLMCSNMTNLRACYR